MKSQPLQRHYAPLQSIHSGKRVYIYLKASQGCKDQGDISHFQRHQLNFSHFFALISHNRNLLPLQIKQRLLVFKSSIAGSRHYLRHLRQTYSLSYEIEQQPTSDNSSLYTVDFRLRRHKESSIQIHSCFDQAYRRGLSRRTFSREVPS